MSGSVRQTAQQNARGTPEIAFRKGTYLSGPILPALKDAPSGTVSSERFLHPSTPPPHHSSLGKRSLHNRTEENGFFTTVMKKSLKSQGRKSPVCGTQNFLTSHKLGGTKGEIPSFLGGKKGSKEVSGERYASRLRWPEFFDPRINSGGAKGEIPSFLGGKKGSKEPLGKRYAVSPNPIHTHKGLRPLRIPPTW